MSNVIPMHRHIKAKAQGAAAVVALRAKHMNLSPDEATDLFIRTRSAVLERKHSVGEVVRQGLAEIRRRMRDNGPQAA